MAKTHVFKIPSPCDQQIIRQKYLKIAFYNSSKNPDNELYNAKYYKNDNTQTFAKRTNVSQPRIVHKLKSIKELQCPPHPLGEIKAENEQIKQIRSSSKTFL